MARPILVVHTTYTNQPVHFFPWRLFQTFGQKSKRSLHRHGTIGSQTSEQSVLGETLEEERAVTSRSECKERVYDQEKYVFETKHGQEIEIEVVTKRCVWIGASAL